MARDRVEALVRQLFEALCSGSRKRCRARRSECSLTAVPVLRKSPVSKHLAILKQAGLVRDRHEGRQTHYGAQLGALARLIPLDKPHGWVLAKPISTISKTC